MSTTRLVGVAIAVFVAIYLLFLGVRPLIVPDEHRYAALGLEMIARGDFTVPRLIGFRYFEKPAGGAHLVAIAVEVFGRDAFAYRLPSALGIGLAAFGLACAVARATGRASIGALAAIALCTMIMPVIVGTTVILDGPFTGFVTASLALAWLALESPRRDVRLGLLALAGLAAGCGFLVKGPLAIVLAAMVIGPWLLWERRWRDLVLVPWIPLLFAGLAVLPWGLAIHEREPEFWRTFLWVEHVQRFLKPDGNQHSEPWWFYLPVLLGATLPWLLAAPAAATGLSIAEHERRLRSWRRFSLCWIALPLCFFSASSGKLATYLLPVLPPIAGLLAIGLVRAFEQRPWANVPSRAQSVPAVVLLVLAAISLLSATVTSLPARVWVDGGLWRSLVLAAGLSMWAVFDLKAIREGVAVRRVLWMGLSPVTLLACFPLLYPSALVPEAKAPSDFILEHRERLESASTLVATEQIAIAIGCELDRYDPLIALAPGELDNHLGEPTEMARLIDRAALVERLASLVAEGPVSVVGQSRHLDPVLEPAIESGALPAPSGRVEGPWLVIVEFGGQDASEH
ncbi:MAG: phospholipid carrier-dependent glycosyltransferase [Phycisphaerales bacterium]